MTALPDFDTQRQVCVQSLHRFQQIAEARGELRRRVGRFGETTSHHSTAGQRLENQAGETSSSRDVKWLDSEEKQPFTGWTHAPGMAASRTRWQEPMGLGNVLKRFIRSHSWDTQTAMGVIMARWPIIVGQAVAAHCHVETFDGHKLKVRCSSTAWAKQLTLLLPRIERRIDEEVGAGVVTQVVIRGPNAPSWKHGPISVPGRGPRDTYG